MRVIALCATSAAAAAPRPNLVFIMADDLGYGEVGSFPATSAVGRIRTPRLDALRASGLAFERAYAGYTVCAPSRTVLMTGVHSGHFAREGLNGEHLGVGEATSVAAALRAAGYRTAAFGKLAPLDDPLRQGFEAFLGQVDQTACHDMYPGRIDAGARPSAEAAVEGEASRGWGNVVLGNAGASRDRCMASPRVYNYTTDVFAAAATAQLERWASDDGRPTTLSPPPGSKPFFLYLSFTTPHAGGWGSTDETGNPTPTSFEYDPKREWPDVERDHAGAITYLDATIGDVLDVLDAAFPNNDTVVVLDGAAPRGLDRLTPPRGSLGRSLSLE